MSLESTDGLKNTAFNYTEGPLFYPFPVQLGREKFLYYSNDTGITLQCPLEGLYSITSYIYILYIIYCIYICVLFFLELYII